MPSPAPKKRKKKNAFFPTFGSQQSKIEKKNILEILSNFHQLINILLIFQFQQFNLFDVSNLHTDNTLN